MAERLAGEMTSETDKVRLLRHAEELEVQTADLKSGPPL